MSGKLELKTSFKLAKTIGSIFAGGKALLSTDGKLLITTFNELVHVSEVCNLKTKVILHGDGEPITAVAIHPDGKQLVTASQSLRIRLYDLSALESSISGFIAMSPSQDSPNTIDYEKLSAKLLVRDWKSHEAPVTVMVFHPDHPSLLATGSADMTIRVWDVVHGLCTHQFRGHRGILTCLRFVSFPPMEVIKKNKKDVTSSDAHSWCLFSASEDGQIRCWDLVSRECTGILEGHASAVRSLDFTKEGDLLSAGRDKVVHVWKRKDRSMVIERSLPVFESLEFMCIINKDTSPSPWVLVAGENGIVRVFDLISWKIVFEEVMNVKSDQTLSVLRGVEDACYCPAMSSLLLIHRDNTLRLMNVKDFSISKHILGHLDDVIDIKHIDRSTVAIATNSERLTIMNIDTMDTYFLEGHTDMILSVDVSSDKSMIATGSKDTTVRLWKKQGNLFVHCVVLEGHTGAVSAVAFNKKKKTSFVVTASQDRTVKMWIIGSITTKAEYTIKAHDKDINALDISPNDKLFVTASQDKSAKLFSVHDGQLISTLSGHKRGIWSVAFSPVDQCLVTASGDKTLKLWSARDFTCIKSFEGHLNSVLKVNFINDGTQLVSAGGDGLVKIWTIKSNECTCTLDNHDDRVWTISFLDTDEKDPLIILSGGADARINVWQDITHEEKIAKLVKQEGLILKEQQLSNYLLRKDYKNAILLAMTLDQPFRLYQLFDAVMSQRADRESITGSLMVDDILGNLSLEETGRLLTYIRDWNTRAKTCRIAQTVLFCVLKTHDANSLISMSSMKELLEALLPYTEKHFQRSCQLMSSAYIVDFTLNNMDVLLDFQPNDKDMGN